MFKLLSLLLIVSVICFGQTVIPVFPFVKKNCNGCHNDSNAAGEVNLARMQKASDFDESREVWERVVSKIRSGEMPPLPLPRPVASDRDKVTHFLDAEFARQDRVAKPDPGRVTARRLNKAEYTNTLRDLLGVDIQPAESFPNDEAAYGFDNIADALSLSPVLLEKYLYAAERAVRTAVFGPEKLKPAAVHYPSPVRIPKLPNDLINYDKTGLSSHHATHVLHRFPLDGEYSFRLVLNGHRPNGSDAVTPVFYIDGKMIQSWVVDAEDLEGRICEVRSNVQAGEHLLSATYLKLYEGLPPKFGGPNPSNPVDLPKLESARGKLTEKDIELLRKYGTRIKTDRVDNRVDNRFESMDVGGPFTQPTGPSALSLQRIFVCKAETDACAQMIMKSFARRAFRRPVKGAELTPYVKLYALARKQGDSFREGIATALQGVLVSPHFLFRVEKDGLAVAKQDYAPLDDYELATRLSYFLWSTMPDETLLRLAGQKVLRQPAVLKAQLARMLRDEKSKALVENFAGQWLQFKNIDVMKPDGDRFPDFDESLRNSMRQETFLFLENMIRQDGSVLEVMDAKHSYLNERLARFYGVPGVVGQEFRRVDMSGTARGGGILAQASVLTTTSYSTRTSPVLRGKWILENLLNAPPPPPPAMVPALDDTKVGESASLRQQMELHRKNPACASCHSRMDPLGFGLENFDGIGKWRDQDGKYPVEATGMLPGNRPFAGPSQLKQLLAQDQEAYVKGLSEKLLIYALGRGLERADRPAVNAIAAGLPAGNYRFSAMVEEIVKSLPFQMRRVTEKP